MVRLAVLLVPQVLQQTGPDRGVLGPRVQGREEPWEVRLEGVVLAGVLLERDENFPEPAELERELAAIRETVEKAKAPNASGRPSGVRDETSGVRDERAPQDSTDTEAPRQRLALAQAALLSALVAGTPAPEGFDRTRLAVQARALASKRAEVVAKVAPELPEILAGAYRPEFLAYAQGHPMTDGYRHDALAFAEHLLLHRRLEGADVQRELSDWWLERSGPAPLSRRPAARLARATRRVLLRR